jgi:hypothetical protein
VNAKSAVEICRFSENPQAFLDLLARAPCPFADAISFPLASRYYEIYYAPGYRGDVSFAVHRAGEPLVVVRGHAVDGTICDNTWGVRVFKAHESVSDVLILDELERATRAAGATTVKVLGTGPSSILDSLSRNLMFRKAAPSVRVLAAANLDHTEAELRAGLRKSYQSLINWGLRTMTFQYITAEAFDAAAFEAFRAFHIETAGRETRVRATWDLQAEMIKANRAELILGSLVGHGMVAGALFLDTGATTTYGVGVYNRDLFDKPLSHAPIFAGMLRARERGQKIFMVGDIPAAQSADDKGFSIGWFKGGFSEDLIAGLEWTYDVPPSKPHGS